MSYSNTYRANTISKYLLYLSIVLLFLGFGMTWLVHNTIKNLAGDAALINQIGIVRGSIQRIVKLRLEGEQRKSQEIIRHIDIRLKSFTDDSIKRTKFHNNKKLHHQINQLNHNFQQLKALINTYDQEPSDNVKAKILSESEIFWQEADSAVLSAQISTENKVSGMKTLYLLLSFNALNIVIVIWIIFTQVRQKLEYQASFDYLTSLRNRHSFEGEIRLEIARSIRYGRPLSLILMDIDHFKQINDEHGHKTGDLVLRYLSGIISENIRKSDSVFRVGGEEFAVIAPESNAHDVLNLAEKIRSAVEKSSFPKIEHVTLSCGVCEFDSDDPETFYKKADKALYKAKNNGRNRTELYDKTIS